MYGDHSQRYDVIILTILPASQQASAEVLKIEPDGLEEDRLIYTIMRDHS